MAAGRLGTAPANNRKQPLYLSPLLNVQDVYGISARVAWQPRVDAKLIVKEMKVTE